MSLKGVELQIAIPKTFDAGKIAEQHQQNVVQQQFNANEALKKETERKQLAVNNTEKINEINDEEKQEGDQQKSHHYNDEKKQSEPQVQHPFKGNLVDFSG